MKKCTNKASQIYINNNLNPAKNVRNPAKDSFTQPLDIKEVLD